VEDTETWETSDDDGNENLLLESQSPEDSPNESDHDPSITVTHAPPASFQKKPNRLQATSSIRNALEIAGELTGSPKGLLRYWKKGSEAQVKEYWDRELETIRAAEDDEAHSIAVKKRKGEDNKREAAKLRKKRQRERVKEAEIKAGVRSPGGTKRKVSARSISNSCIT
jgi:hypothetical protein